MANSQSKFYGILALIFVAGSALIGYVVVSSRGSTDSGASDVSLQALLNSGLSAEDLGIARGPADAPVLIEEYADYQCGACGMAATLTVPQVLEYYVDTGKARFIYHDFPLRPGSPAELGAQAARCADEQNAFWPMHKVLMGRQREWGPRRDVTGMFRQYADGLGLDGRALESCVKMGKYRDVVLASGEAARQRGLNQTPTFFINGRMIEGLMGFDRFAELIEQELARVEGAAQAPGSTEDR